MDGEEGELGIGAEAVVGLVTQAHSEPLQRAGLRGQVDAQIMPDWLL